MTSYDIFLVSLKSKFTKFMKVEQNLSNHNLSIQKIVNFNKIPH